MAEYPSIPTRSSLLGRLKNWQDEASWTDFAQIDGKLIRDFAIKSGLNLDEAEEVAQETLIELADRLKTFTYDRKKGSFKGWLFNLISWRVANQFKQRQSRLVSLDSLPAGDASLVGQSAEVSSLQVEVEAFWEQEWQQTMLDAALKKLRKQLPHKHYQALQMIVQQGLPVMDVARLLGMRRTQVYLLKFRGLIRLKKQIAILEKGRI